MQACKQFREQIAVFDAQFVYLDGSVVTSYSDEKFLPLSFTLYTLVQRHLLQEEMQKNKVMCSYKYEFGTNNKALQTTKPDKGSVFFNPQIIIAILLPTKRGATYYY